MAVSADEKCSEESFVNHDSTEQKPCKYFSRKECFSEQDCVPVEDLEFSHYCNNPCLVLMKSNRQIKELQTIIQDK